MPHVGEAGHWEYDWSTQIHERIVQFHFQATRGADLSWVADEFRYILNLVALCEHAPEYYELLVRLTCHTRDVVMGKGEYAIAYVMLYEWSRHASLTGEDFSQRLLERFVSHPHGDHPFGSWKDIKYYCDYCRSRGDTSHSPRIQHAIRYMNHQLRCDATQKSPSLAAKWVPREKSSFGWLFEALATHYFQEYLSTATTPEQQAKAISKCKRNYRLLISSLNRRLNTVQIKQCHQQWSEIDFRREVTSSTLAKQTKAFLNLGPSFDEDRIACASQFQQYVQCMANGHTIAKGERVGVETLISKALNPLTEEERTILNAQWANKRDEVFGKHQGGKKVIAMIDTSHSMSGDPMAVAVALGVCIAEMSLFENRVLLVDDVPTWLNLSNCADFVDKVRQIYSVPWGGVSNVYKAVDVLLSAIKESNLSPSKVRDITLVFLSDMQCEPPPHTRRNAEEKKHVALYDALQQRFSDVGIPHVIFWNLRTTNGFPCLFSHKNASTSSGYNPTVLASFLPKFREGKLVHQLQNKRYHSDH